MADPTLSPTELAHIEDAVALFADKRELFEGFATGLLADFQLNRQLSPHIHFIKYRIKDPDHLRAKLARKAQEALAAGNTFTIDQSNLFERVTDLAGIRLIHLHTSQISTIHPILLDIFEEQRLRLVEPPTANCWDVEYETLFSALEIAARSRNSMYTTVHYVVEANRRTKITCEVQVRTLMDEVWAEVSHRVNYPHPTRSRACGDQLKVLARLTTGCARLVDSIFESHREAPPEI